MSNELRQEIYLQLLKVIRARIDWAIKLPDDTPLSLAYALNLLFLIRGSVAQLEITGRLFGLSELRSVTI
jgi:hypothetical protein